jgi:protease IV
VKSFFKSFLASLLALLVFFGIIFLLFFGIAGALMSADSVQVGQNAVLVIDLSDPITERKMDDPLTELTGEVSAPDLYTTIKLIKHASEDSLIRGIYLIAKDNPNGFATSQELRRALEAFKKKGKFIMAYGDYISQKAFHVASVADKIYCHPMGILEWQGMSVEYVFFKGLIDRLDIKPQIFYAGKYKSATEPFRETAMTSANREQTNVWLNGIYNQMVADIAASRKLSADSLLDLASNYTLDKPEKAVAYKLIDGVRYDDEVRNAMHGLLKIKPTDPIDFIRISKYAKAVNVSGTYSKNRVALVIAEGSIMYGKASPDEVGSDEYLSVLRKLRNDEGVKAVVLRVNSPGGSSLASEIIWREIELMKKAGKKVVVSMGDVAASGGYYIACNADRVFAQPNTITGSIGVFSVVPDFSSFMKNKLGVTFDRVQTGPYADLPSVTRPMTQQEKQIIQNQVDQIYNDFKSKVATGRKKSINYIDSIAQGRVWTGKDALQIGLVDEMGGLEDAIAAAAKMASLKEFKVRVYPEPRSFLEYVLENYEDEFSSIALGKELNKEELKLLKQIRDLKNEQGEIKAKLPFEFNIK